MINMYMRINEDYLDDVSYDDIALSDDSDMNQKIKPGRWHNCIHFQLQDASQKRQFRQYRQMLDAILGRYLNDYDICILPWSQACMLDEKEINGKMSGQANYYTSDNTDVVFIQFNSPQERRIPYIFYLKLFTFLQTAFKFSDNQFRKFSSMSPHIARDRNGQYVYPNYWEEMQKKPYYSQLIKKFAMRLGEAIEQLSLLQLNPLYIKRAPKQKQEIYDFLWFLAATFDCDVSQSECEGFVDSYINKAQEYLKPAKAKKK